MKPEGGNGMEKRLLIHLPKEEHEWLRRESFQTGRPMAEIMRRGLALYKKQKEELKMRKIEVVIIEAGDNYLDRLESFEMELPEDENQAVAKAIKEVEARGYKVIPNDHGGCTEYVSVSGGEDYIAVTVAPSAE